MNLSRCAIALLCLMNAPPGATAQSKEPPRNKELETLQAHFELVIGRRHEQLFKLDHHRRAVGAPEAAGERRAHADAVARHALA